MEYPFSSIEKKWQDFWDEHQSFKAENNSDKPKFFVLVEFPYPSGQGLHVGHPRSYTALDSVARMKRMQGFNVLFPMGWDAYGLPTENFAIKNHIHPRIVTERNVANFKRQLKSIGFSFDWSREINTTDPSYYKWTQWIFLKLFEKGLAYKKEMPINWCTVCKCGLANEEVVNGVCERCGGEVVQKNKNQWMLKITAYADRLIDDLETIDFLEKIKTQQKNWIGKSTGAEVKFALDGVDDSLTVFTTRPDTLFGATYMVISPEHPMLEKYADKITNIDAVNTYRREAAKKSEFERTELVHDKTGVKLEGICGINPVNGNKLPIFVSDYVLMTYGTGAIMAVPAHDTRDWDFAKKFDLPIIEVVSGGENVQEAAYTDVANGTMINSGMLDGLSCQEAIKTIIAWLEEKGLGKEKVNFKLRDWVFSRQRYWGEPIPIVHCPKCGQVPVPYEQLPLTLPDIEDFEPDEDGGSPLNRATEWINTTCPACGGAAQRETDTMPQWAGSSWYFLRYTDPHNDEALASPEALNYWMPVDWYNGGMEHTTLHLLYSRFWHKFLYDVGVVPGPEPYQKRTSHGMILGENNEKMSKSRGNVVNPDEMVETYGADSLRAYELFIGAFDQTTPWKMDGIKGCHNFLKRVWNMLELVTPGEGYGALETSFHKAIKKVGEDLDKTKFNTAIATLMALSNEIYKQGSITKDALATFIMLLNPVAPHITEEMWQRLSLPGVLSSTPWPVYDEAKTVDDVIEIAVTINGKVRGKISVPQDISKEDLEAMALANESVKPFLEGKTLKKIIAIPGKIVNIVVQ